MTFNLPQVIGIMAGYYFLNACASAMWPPTEQQKPRAYGFVYRLAQRLAANADRLIEARFPGLPSPNALPPGTAVVASKTTTTDTAAIVTPE